MELLLKNRSKASVKDMCLSGIHIEAKIFRNLTTLDVIQYFTQTLASLTWTKLKIYITHDETGQTQENYCATFPKKTHKNCNSRQKPLHPRPTHAGIRVTYPGNGIIYDQILLVDKSPPQLTYIFSLKTMFRYGLPTHRSDE